MKVAIFDPFSGAGGDMIVATLLGVSLSESDLMYIVESLNLKIDFEIKDVNVGGISAKKVYVKSLINEDKNFKDVVEIIKNSKLDNTTKNDSIAIFEILAKAEAKVHGKNFENAKFHEVGADDAIFDVVASVTGIRRLINDGYEFYANPVVLGSGYTEFSHGVYPVPAPATLEIVKNSQLEILFNVGDGELFTPTAAAIFSYYCKGPVKFPVKVESITYGAGTRKNKLPNVLRLILGHSPYSNEIALIETLVDDVTGEIIGFAIDELLKVEGVYDVSIVPTYSKKSRLSALIKIVGDISRSEEIAAELMKLTGTLGVRIIPVYHRIATERELLEKEIEIKGKKFKVRYKVSRPSFRRIKPEFDDVADIARKLDMPILEVYREVLRVLENDNTDRE